MFSINHFIWIFICFVLVGLGYICLSKDNPSFKKIVDIAFYFALISELIKIFSVIEMVPIDGKDGLYPYLELRYLPLHLCSLHILSFIYLKFSKKDSAFKTWLLSFMYPSCILGGILAILLPSIFSTSVSVNEAFTHPLAYQTFLYHTMLILFGIYISKSKEVNLTKDGFRKSIVSICLLSFLSLYLNSIFTIPVYENGKLVSVATTTNFFFTSLAPLPIPFSSKLHWFIYLLVICIIAFGLIYLLYLPIIKRDRHG